MRQSQKPHFFAFYKDLIYFTELPVVVGHVEGCVVGYVGGLCGGLCGDSARPCVIWGYVHSHGAMYIAMGLCSKPWGYAHSPGLCT